MPPPETPSEFTAPEQGCGRVPSDDLEIELDPDLLHGSDHDDAHHHPADEPAVVVPAGPLPRPWHSDPNYQTLCEMRDVMATLARSGAKVTPKDRIAAARAAMAASTDLIGWFGVETGEADDAAEQAAVNIGREVARRAVNSGMFGAPSPQAPAAWVTAPGNPHPKRNNGSG